MSGRKNIGTEDVVIQEDGSELLWNGVVVFREWDVAGKTYRPGDLIKVDGIAGTTRFWSAQRSADGVWSVTVWWEGHHFRDISIDRVKATNRVAVVPEQVSGRGSREIKKQLFEDFVAQREGGQVSTKELTEASGLSAPTVSRLLAEQPHRFQKVKRGTFSVLAAHTEKEG